MNIRRIIYIFAVLVASSLLVSLEQSHLRHAMPTPMQETFLPSDTYIISVNVDGTHSGAIKFDIINNTCFMLDSDNHPSDSTLFFTKSEALRFANALGTTTLNEAVASIGTIGSIDKSNEIALLLKSCCKTSMTSSDLRYFISKISLSFER